MNRTQELEASLVRYPGGAVLERHAHAQASISLVLAGSIEEEVDGRTEVGRIGSVVSKPVGVEHRNRIGGQGAVLLAIKGSHVDAVSAPRWSWTQPPKAAAFGLQLARSLKLGVAVESEDVIDLLGFTDQTCEARGRHRWLDDIRSRLDRESNPPSVSDLALISDVHPVYLARAFRNRFGCSIRDYRRKTRVRRAADLLASSNLPIAAIAADLDFFDQSHLCRDFRTELGVSPRHYRAVIRS